MENDEILTKEELAKILKVTVRTVDRLRKEGMPFFRVASVIRFNKQKVFAWLEKTSQRNSKEVVA